MQTTDNPFKQGKKLKLSKLRYRAKLTQRLKDEGTTQQKRLATFMIKNSVPHYRDTSDYRFEELKKAYAKGLFWRVDNGRLKLWSQTQNAWGQAIYMGDWSDGIGKTICDAILYKRISFNDLQLFFENKHDGERKFS